MAFNEMKVTRHGFWGIVAAIAGGKFTTWLWGNPIAITAAVIISPFLAGVGRELYGMKKGAKFSWRDVWLTSIAGWIVGALGWLSVLVGNFWQLPK